VATRRKQSRTEQFSAILCNITES